ncbi:hypothetical protein CUU54_19855 [Pectobacterium polaris]|uniref:hypothetical protein n=1 Tax=Pectobacterium polaris TaxID=2042057 RepID=UPI0011B20C36|nr:hypothetical protein [Pectobacterium polaris]MCU1791095.1 hypothetical protein [Pectobacterium polaris]
MAIGDDALRDAIRFYTQWVDGIISSAQQVPNDEWRAPLFTYILTKRQLNQLNVICKKEGWPRQTCPGITIYPQQIKHIITSRAKDGLNWIQVVDILSASFCTRSEVAMNKDRNMQGVILNANERLSTIPAQKYFGMAILQVSENDLAPVTAYHATEAKIKAIKK